MSIERIEYALSVIFSRRTGRKVTIKCVRRPTT